MRSRTGVWLLLLLSQFQLSASVDEPVTGAADGQVELTPLPEQNLDPVAPGWAAIGVGAFAIFMIILLIMLPNMLPPRFYSTRWVMYWQVLAITGGILVILLAMIPSMCLVQYGHLSAGMGNHSVCVSIFGLFSVPGNPTLVMWPVLLLVGTLFEIMLAVYCAITHRHSILNTRVGFFAYCAMTIWHLLLTILLSMLPVIDVPSFIAQLLATTFCPIHALALHMYGKLGAAPEKADSPKWMLRFHLLFFEHDDDRLIWPHLLSDPAPDLEKGPQDFGLRNLPGQQSKQSIRAERHQQVQERLTVKNIERERLRRKYEAMRKKDRDAIAAETAALRNIPYGAQFGEVGAEKGRPSLEAASHGTWQSHNSRASDHESRALSEVDDRLKRTLTFQPGRLGLTHDDENKAFVHKVTAGTQAHKLGVRPGWHILSVNGSLVSDKDAVQKVKQAKDTGKPFDITFEVPPDDEADTRIHTLTFQPGRVGIKHDAANKGRVQDVTRGTQAHDLDVQPDWHIRSVAGATVTDKNCAMELVKAAKDTGRSYEVEFVVPGDYEPPPKPNNVVGLTRTIKVTFQPGRIGLTHGELDKRRIKKITRGTQASELGVQLNWRINAVSGQPVTMRNAMDLIATAKEEGKPFEVVFEVPMESPGPDEKRGSSNSPIDLVPKNLDESSLPSLPQDDGPEITVELDDDVRLVQSAPPEESQSESAEPSSTEEEEPDSASDQPEHRLSEQKIPESLVVQQQAADSEAEPESDSSDIDDAALHNQELRSLNYHSSASESSVEGTGALKAGDKVDVKQRDGSWKPGKLDTVSASRTSSFKVEYTDAPGEIFGVPERLVRRRIKTGEVTELDGADEPETDSDDNTEEMGPTPAEVRTEVPTSSGRSHEEPLQPPDSDDEEPMQPPDSSDEAPMQSPETDDEFNVGMRR